jgi:hypothetical protein
VDGVVDGEVDGVVLGEVGGCPDANWLKKFQTTPEVQVCQPSPVLPSMGPGSWPAPSNAAQTTG